MNILIAVPCMSSVPTPFAESLLNLQKPDGTKVCLHQSSLVYDARNLLCLTAIQQKFDYVMWLDSDMTFAPDTVTRLLNCMQEPHTEIVTGLYVKRTFPTVPVIYHSVQPPKAGDDGIMRKQILEYIDYPKDSVFTVEGCGFGCVMTSVKILKAVWDKFGAAFTPLPWAGEDVSFCWRVNQIERGLIWCDSRVKCGHIGQFLFTEDMLKKR